MPNHIHQPPSCRQPLPQKELPPLSAFAQRIITFDPTPIFNTLETKNIGDPFKRYNIISIHEIFTQVKHFCTCGCGRMLSGKQTRWASKECSDFPYEVTAIICGRMDTYRPYIFAYYGRACTNCGDTDGGLEIDHLIPVWAGGGLCWLSNLRPLCITCHKEKTKLDYQLHNDADQPSLF